MNNNIISNSKIPTLFCILFLTFNVMGSGDKIEYSTEDCCGGVINVDSIDAKFTSKYERLIVGGEIANKTDWPWIVSLNKYDSHWCGGSLIAPQWVLTAAHCVVDRSRNARSSKIYTVAVGAHRLSEVSQKIRVSKVIIHPDYDDDTMVNDVALLKLERPVNNVQLLNLNNRSSLPKTGTNATVIGWGALWEDGDYPDVLRQVSLPIVSNATANKAQSYGGDITQEMLAAGYSKGGKDSCQGDSGGPLIVKEDGEWLQVGVVSWGHGCARANKYGIYARVSKYVEWIEGRIGSETGNQTKKPSIVVQPKSILIEPGSDVSFSVDAIGTGPLDYQWYFNGKPISGENQSLLTLKNAGRDNDSGKYYVVVSNNYGSVTSLSAELQFIDVIPLAEALDASMLIWSNGGDANWTGQMATASIANSSSAQSGTIHNNEQSWVQTTIQGPGVLSFQWKVSSETDWDYLALLIDGSEKRRISGEVDWNKMSISIGSSRHQLRWVYKKDKYLSSGKDAAWLDQVKFQSGQVNASESLVHEQFSTNENTRTWNIDVEGEIYFPNWSAETKSLEVKLEDENVWIFANNGVMEGAFTGNYNDPRVKRISTDIWVSQNSNLTSVSFYFLSSESNQLFMYDIDQLPNSDGWNEISASLGSGDWYSIGDELKFGAPSNAALHSVSEVGVFLIAGASDSLTTVRLDNFKLNGEETDQELIKPILSLPRHNFKVDEKITVLFDRSSGTKKDWIGLYQLGAEAPAIPSISWWYCDGTKSGNETIKKGEVVFVDGIPVPGDYEARLYSNDGYELLSSAEFSVSERPTISPSKGSFSFEEKITLNFTNPNPTALDWIGIYNAGDEAPAIPSIMWLYTDGTKTGNQPIEDGQLSFDMAVLPEGEYEMRLFGNDGYQLLASSLFSVVKDRASKPTISIKRNSDRTITITFEGKLQAASSINGPWETIDTASPVTIIPGELKEFARAVQE